MKHNFCVFIAMVSIVFLSSCARFEQFEISEKLNQLVQQQNDNVDATGLDEQIDSEVPEPGRDLYSDEQAQALRDGFVVPSHHSMTDAEILQRLPDIDGAGVVPKDLLAQALAFYDANQARIPNKRFMSVVDFKRNSRELRLWIIDMTSGITMQLTVAHGTGSDRNDDGLAEKFSNIKDSNASSLGFYLAAEPYQGKHGLSVRLDGLSDTNSNARKRDVVFHGAKYVKGPGAKQGRSWGCLAIPMGVKDTVFNMVKGGSLVFAGVSAN